jgi:hypothetical protein
MLQSLYQEAVRLIAKSGAQLMLFTVLENTGNKGRGAEVWQKRFSEFNKGVRQSVLKSVQSLSMQTKSASLVIVASLHSIALHFNAEGHNRCAQAVLEKLRTCHLILHGAHRCHQRRKLHGLLKSSSLLHGSSSSHFHGSSAEFEASHRVMAEALNTQFQPPGPSSPATIFTIGR